ncbi:MAG: hypothetical protein ACK4HV_06970, partial [Parachlamydiaceae bacterium]
SPKSVRKMINSTIQTLTNASIFTAIGGTTAYVASSYKAILPAVPRLNPFKASPIGLTAPVAVAITGAFFAANLMIFAIYALAKEPQMDLFTRNVLSGVIVIGSAAALGVNPLTALALIVSTIVLNSLFDQHLLLLNRAWGL